MLKRMWILTIAVVMMAMGSQGLDPSHAAAELVMQLKTGIALKGDITINGGFVCGTDVTFTYRGSGVTYGTVAGANNECWLDRNLGASQVATSRTDYPAYGDLFQWGRLDDGHQTIVWTSATGSNGAEQSRETSTNSSGDVPGHDDFILETISPYDWRDPQNPNLWQGENSTNNPCPSTWRLPTKTEWETEYAGWSSQDHIGAYASPLKLTVGGMRDNGTGGLGAVGNAGYCYTSTVGSTTAFYLEFLVGDVHVWNSRRAYGFSVRCIKD